MGWGDELSKKKSERIRMTEANQLFGDGEII